MKGASWPCLASIPAQRLAYQNQWRIEADQLGGLRRLRTSSNRGLRERVILICPQPPKSIKLMI
jgi:hypothetical protein